MPGTTVRLLPARLARHATPPLAGRSFLDMDYRLQLTDQGTLLTTETRVHATDPKSDRAFARYWLFVRPPAGAIRHEVFSLSC